MQEYSWRRIKHSILRQCFVVLKTMNARFQIDTPISKFDHLPCQPPLPPDLNLPNEMWHRGIQPSITFKHCGFSIRIISTSPGRPRPKFLYCWSWREHGSTHFLIPIPLLSGFYGPRIFRSLCQKLIQRGDHWVDRDEGSRTLVVPSGSVFFSMIAFAWLRSSNLLRSLENQSAKVFGRAWYYFIRRRMEK